MEIVLHNVLRGILYLKTKTENIVNNAIICALNAQVLQKINLQAAIIFLININLISFCTSCFDVFLFLKSRIYISIKEDANQIVRMDISLLMDNV